MAVPHTWDTIALWNGNILQMVEVVPQPVLILAQQDEDHLHLISVVPLPTNVAQSKRGIGFESPLIVTIVG
jgi:hypothetical protein